MDTSPTTAETLAIGYGMVSHLLECDGIKASRAPLVHHVARYYFWAAFTNRNPLVTVSTREIAASVNGSVSGVYSAIRRLETLGFLESPWLTDSGCQTARDVMPNTYWNRHLDCLDRWVACG